MDAPQPQTEAKPEPIFVIMPVLAQPEYTRAAIADVLAQTVPTRLLIVNQGVDDAFREELERIAEAHSDRVFLWSHVPSLLSLAATWNRALDFVWETGGECALVVNNDVRLRADTVEMLEAVLTFPKQQNLFVSCVGVTPEQFDPTVKPLIEDHPGGWSTIPDLQQAYLDIPKGGPDFSCFLISKACHDRYRFDENFTPAFCEDLDYHRRLLLDGEGDKIFSVNLPYLHYGSATIKSVDSKTKARIESAISAGSRAYYEKKWGGPVNNETFYAPFNQVENCDPFLVSFYPQPPTTPALQSVVEKMTSGLALR